MRGKVPIFHQSGQYFPIARGKLQKSMHNNDLCFNSIGLSILCRLVLPEVRR